MYSVPGTILGTEMTVQRRSHTPLPAAQRLEEHASPSVLALHFRAKLEMVGRDGKWDVYSWNIDAIKRRVQSPFKFSEQRPGQAHS